MPDQIILVTPERGATQELIVSSIGQLSTTPRSGLTIAYAKDAQGGGRRFNYLPSSAGLTPNGGTIFAAADGGFWVINRPNKSINVEDFGIVYGSTEDQSAILNLATSVCNDVTISGDVTIISNDIELYSGQTLRFTNNATITRLGEGDRGVFYTGNMTAHVYDMNVDYKSCNDVEVGDYLLTFNTASDANGFQAGDIVCVTGGVFFNRTLSYGTFKLHEHGGLNVVDSVGDGFIRLKYGMLYSFNNVNVGIAEGMSNYGTPVKAIKDIKILGYPNIVAKNAGKLFREGGGVINGYFEIGTFTGGSCLLGNNYNYCWFHVRESYFERQVYEWGVLSMKNIVYIDYAEMKDTPGELNKFPLRLSEASNFNYLKIKTLNMNEREGTAMYFREVSDNEIIINTMFAKDSGTILNLGSQEHQPNTFDFDNNIFEINKCHSEGNGYGLRIQNQGGKSKRFTLIKTEFLGTYNRVLDVTGTNPRFINCKFPNGIVTVQNSTVFEEFINCEILGSFTNTDRIKDNGLYLIETPIFESPKPVTKLVRSIFKKLNFINVLSTLDTNLIDETIFPMAVNYEESTIIKYTAGFRRDGNVSPAFFKIILAGETLFTIELPEGALASTLSHVVITGKIHFISITSCSFVFSWNGVASGALANTINIPSTAINDTKIETFAWKDSLDDGFSLRQLYIEAKEQ